MITDKHRLVKAIKTGKAPQRRNLFKHTFALAGLPYKGLKFSDGVTKKDGSKRVVIFTSASPEEVAAKLYFFFDKVSVLKGYSGDVNITYKNPYWEIIDELRK